VLTVGLVGGLGPESTIDYYRRILATWQREDPSSAPSIVIDSLDVLRGLRLVASDRGALADYLLASLDRLARAGVDFAAITANTPHLVFDDLARRSSIPLLSIVEVCAGEVLRRGCSRPALLGTRFTMDATFYPDVFTRHGIDLVVPDATDRAWIHDRYVGQLLRGDFRDETRQEVVALVRQLREREGIDAVILGGTELPLLLTSPDIDGLPLLDTTELHVNAIIDRLRARSAEPATVPVP
jgi:aspartate racemase